MAGVEVNGQEPVGASCREKVCHQPGGNGNAGLVFLVGASIAVIGDNGGDTARGCPL